MAQVSPLFEQARLDFRGVYQQVKQRWPNAHLISQALPSFKNSENPAVERIEAIPTLSHDQVLILTLGEHGIEGYIGAFMLDLFVRDFLDKFDPKTTGLILFQAINPWGMEHLRRTNQNNVDLNRNFVWDEDQLDPESNPGYARLEAFLAPQGPVRSKPGWKISFLAGLGRALAIHGMQGFKRAYTLGQYRFPKGIYYGGSTVQEETRLAMKVFQTAFRDYSKVLLIDIHTGFGPRFQMAQVNSVHESLTIEALQRRFGYPLIVKSNPEVFFSIHGDMIDYFYALGKKEAPQKSFYGVSFEFGSFGDSLPAGIRTIQAQVLENQVYWFGAKNRNLEKWSANEIMELFNPSDPGWLQKAADDGRKAFSGILRAEGFIRS